MAGPVATLSGVATGRLEFTAADPRIPDAFGACGAIAPRALTDLRGHAAVLYVHCEGRSVEAAMAALQLGDAFLRLGAHGVKVETAGLAHGKSQWRALATDVATRSARPGLDVAGLYDRARALYRAFVVNVTRDETLYTCGMAAFGHPDLLIRLQVRALGLCCPAFWGQPSPLH